MHFTRPVLFALGLLLAGCAQTTATAPSIEAAQNGPIGYHYYDNQHPNAINNPSPEALYNAQHGTWLWPPATDIVR
jgi:hypothetical protein